MAKGDIKAGRSPLIGNAGEYYVMAELLMRGWVAGMTPRGAHAHDIIATKGERVIEVRVKTKTADAQIFRWNKKGEHCLPRVGDPERDFCVLVDILAGTEGRAFSPRFYVASSAEVAAKLNTNFLAWVSTPGKNGRQRSPDSTMVAIDTRTDAPWLMTRLNRWDLLEGSSA